MYHKQLFRTHLVTGRAVVCLEQYPSSISPLSKRQSPVFALRVLEFLTPMKRLFISNDIPEPKPGQLLRHRYPKTQKCVPWGYSPYKTDTRAAITDWIRAQSISS
jgi:hypothetical protein